MTIILLKSTHVVVLSVSRCLKVSKMMHKSQKLELNLTDFVANIRVSFERQHAVAMLSKPE